MNTLLSFDFHVLLVFMELTYHLPVQMAVLLLLQILVTAFLNYFIFRSELFSEYFKVCFLAVTP